MNKARNLDPRADFVMIILMDFEKRKAGSS
jgi:hypothetical protein